MKISSRKFRNQFLITIRNEFVIIYLKVFFPNTALSIELKNYIEFHKQNILILFYSINYNNLDKILDKKNKSIIMLY